MVQRRLDKIYDWESKFALRPTRSLIKYLRAVLRESANAAAAVAADPLGSGAMGMIVMLLSGSPCASVIQKDFPEVRTVRKTSREDGSERHLHSTMPRICVYE